MLLKCATRPMPSARISVARNRHGTSIAHVSMRTNAVAALTTISLLSLGAGCLTEDQFGETESALSGAPLLNDWSARITAQGTAIGEAPLRTFVRATITQIAMYDAV